MSHLPQNHHALRHLAFAALVALLSCANGADITNSPTAPAGAVPANDASFPLDFTCEPQPFYRHRKDGKPGRELKVDLVGGRLHGEATAEVVVSGGPAETIPLEAVPGGFGDFRLLLPPGVGVDKEAQVSITLWRGKNSLAKQVIVPPKRQWTVYIYPHSHVDVGYTNTHENVEFIHKQNLLKGIELARKTADWPEGSRFVWNPEVTWPIERYLATATPAEREVVFDAIRKGWIGVDAGYINDNTSVASDEEMFHYIGYKAKLEKATGVRVDSLMQTDVPGMSWGVVPAAAESGIRYIMAFHNGGDRTGNTNDLNYRPFWWESPDRKSRVLFFQQGSYVPGAAIKGMSYAVAMMGQTNRETLKKQLDSVKTKQPRANFADKYFLPTMQLLETGSAAPFDLAPLASGFLAYLKHMENTSFYPYDILVMSWAMADNTPVDQDLPEAVRSWNEEYAYPHLVIAGTHTIMSAFEKKYGDKLPVLRGDFTEYWTDGLGTAAKQTGMNRHAKERLVQADTLWAMLNPGVPAPRADFDEAWRNVVLASEHTWAYSSPDQQPMQDLILKAKFGRFDQADKRSKELESRALAPLTGKEGPLIAVFNTLSWERSELVILSADQSRAGSFVRDETGVAVPSQRLSTGELVFMASNVPAFGARNYVLGNQANEFKYPAASAQDLTLDNGIVRVTLDPATGNVASLVMGGRDFVDTKAGGALNSYHYLRGAEDGAKALGPTEVKISVKEKGPLVASLLVESKAEGSNRLVREVRIAAGSAEVAFDNLIDKIATTEKEGVHFGYAFNLPGARTRADIPWGVMEVEKDQLKAGNRNWIAFQRWLDMSNADAGITWASLDAPVFEYGKISANILGGALYSPQWIKELTPSSTIYSWALNNHWHTNFPLSQSGLLPFRYRILPHASGYDAAAANRFGTAQAQPLVATQVKAKTDIATRATIDNPRVVITVLRAEAGGKLQLRLRSLSDRPEKANVTFSDGRTKGANLGPLGMETLDAED